MTRYLWYVAGLVALAGCAIPAYLMWGPKPAGSPPEALKAGDKAPDFTLSDQNRRTVKLSDFLGKKNVVLAFYIKAATPG